MKKIFLLFFCCSFLLNAFELPLKTGKLRNSKGFWNPPELSAVKPSRSAELFFAFDKVKDFSKFNRAEIEITPLDGKFIKRNFLLSFFSGKELARLRPENAPGNLILELNKKVVLRYSVNSSLKNITALRLFFNRKNDDRSNQKFLLHKIRFFNEVVPRRSGEFRHKVDTKVCALLADDDRGYTFAEARAGNFGKRLQKRPTPVAGLLPDLISGKSTVEKEDIPLEILNETPFSRNTQLRFGVPFAKGKVFSLENLSLADEKGKVLPAQFAVLSRYEDKSLRHIFVTSSAVLAPREKKIYTFSFGNKVRSAKIRSTLKSLLSNGVLTVDAGRVKAEINRKNFNFLQNLTVDGKNAGRFLPLEIVLADGKKYTLSDPDTFEIIESGPLRLTLRAAGKYTGNAGSYVCRITFFYNKPQFDIEFTHINSVTDMEFTDFASLSLNFLPAEKISKQGRFFQETDLHYSVNGGKRQPGQLSGAFKLNDRFGIAVADWYQRYPKAVSARDKGVAIELLPVQPHKKFNTDLPLKLSYLYTNGNYRMKWGMSFTERISFDFSGTSEKHLAAERNLPLFAVLPFDYYRKAGFALDDTALAPVDAAVTKTFYRYLQRQKEEREYGFFNYGDSFGERGHSWTNNEYDPVHGILETYLRTGNRDMLRYGIASARHQADVDTCHAYPDEYFIGANLQHSVGHTGIGRRWSHLYTRYSAASNGHSWARGRLLVWLLTGDTLVMDSCYMFGDHTAFAVVPNYKTILGKAPRETGWMLRALSALYAVTGDREYRKAAQTMAHLAVKECAYDKGAWPRVIRRLDSMFGIKQMGNNNFQVGVMLKGLCDYYKIFPEPQVAKAIISSARWLAKGFNPGNSAGFNYDIDINGRGLNWPVSATNSLLAPPLAEASAIARDPRLFSVAERAFARVLLGRHAIDHKHFAMEWTFLADYLHAAAAWNKLHNKKSDYSRSAQIKVLLQDTVPQWRMRGAGKWFIISTKDNAKITLTRWIRSGKPTLPVKLVLRKDGKIISEKTLPPGILRQDIPLVLPGKKNSRFILDITDSFSGDWCMTQDSQALYAAAMPPKGIAVSHNGFHRFFIEVPAGKSVTVSYAGSHAGDWSIDIRDGEKVFSHGASTSVTSLHELRRDAVKFKLPAGKKRIAILDCFSSTDARIIVSDCDKISADKRFFQQEK